MPRSLLPLLLLTTACAASEAAPGRRAEVASDVTAAPVPKPDPALHELHLTALDGSPFDAAALEGKAVLVVNVASKCGFTPQYEGLQALHARFADDGLVVLGVPSNQFAGQEPGDAEKIASFCKLNYGVTFPLLEKQDVNGKHRSELYQLLVDSAVGGGAAVKWNFEKFVVSASGTVMARFPSATKPSDPELLAAVQTALATR